MKPSPKSSSSRIAEIIENRSAADRHDLVKGWHNLLAGLFTQMAPYLREGHLVTFRTLDDKERAFFEELHRNVAVPPSAGAIYLPPSVRFQMMHHRPDQGPQPAADPSAENPPDKGIVMASRTADAGIIVNALLAKPPFAPAIDVYDDGQLLAGYVYNTIDECIAALSKVLQIHLLPGTPSETA